MFATRTGKMEYWFKTGKRVVISKNGDRIFENSSQNAKKEVMSYWKTLVLKYQKILTVVIKV